MIHQYNDSELLYLMYENCEIALGILFNKYKNLIKKRLTGFRIHQKNYEDFYQEGLMILFKAYYTYNPFMGKSFNKYFDMILQRKIIGILRKEKPYFYNVVLVGDPMLLLKESEAQYYEEEYEFNFTKLEEKVFQMRYNQNIAARIIAEELNLDVKKIYNVLFAVKRKIRLAKNK